MSESHLRRLHAQGPEGMKPGAWDILDEELRRRRGQAEAAVAAQLAEERYPALRSIIGVLKVLAVLSLIACVLGAIISFKDSPLISLGAIVFGLWVALTYWASSELLALLIDVEANTRALRHPLRTMGQ